jgi:hypothetical protein
MNTFSISDIGNKRRKQIGNGNLEEARNIKRFKKMFESVPSSQKTKWRKMEKDQNAPTRMRGLE